MDQPPIAAHEDIAEHHVLTVQDHQVARLKRPE
jgi:hypothetical protein